MKRQPFVGRRSELNKLHELKNRNVASLVVIKGRRRIGKSRLVEEFSKGKRIYSFSGLPPQKGLTDQDQRHEFNRKLDAYFQHSLLTPTDWADLFTEFSKHVKTGPVIIFFDEISWMAQGDPTFLGKLKNCWDQNFKKNSDLLLILCGSVSTWIDKHILGSTGFFGRITSKISVPELSINESTQMLKSLRFSGSAQEIFMILSITGGIPWYLELIDPNKTAVQNIAQLCFYSDGILVNEFTNIFENLFGRRSIICQKIVEALGMKSLEYGDLANQLNYASGGPLTDYLLDLAQSGFIKKDSSWRILSKKKSRISLYRLKDNYLRFYLRYIAPNLDKIMNNRFEGIDLELLPSFAAMMGLQFENLVLNNRVALIEKLGLSLTDIEMDNPYLQRKTKKHEGCQIDYLIQTKFNNLLACEMKFSRNRIGSEIITEIENKINRLVLPKSFSCFPVLIHVNGVTDSVHDSTYFKKIIDFSDFI